MKQRNAVPVQVAGAEWLGAPSTPATGSMQVVAEPPLVALTHVSKRFGTQWALDDVAVELHAGQVHGLVGHNGSGKSTLVKLLSGFHAPEPGSRAAMDGRPLLLGDAIDARRAGLRFVHQQLGLIESLSVVDNIMLGATYPETRAWRIDWRLAHAEAAVLLARLGSSVDPAATVATLSPIQRTAVAIARALRDREAARVLVLDEPTAALPADGVDALMTVLRRLRAEGLAILYISHHLDEVLAIADHVTVLRDGRRVATRPADGLDEDALVELMLGHAIDRSGPVRRAPVSDAAPVLRARALRAGHLARLDLDVRPGEVVGLAGVDGSGRDDVPGALFGATPRTGTVEVGTTTLAPERPDLAIRAGLGLLGADRAATGLIEHLSVRENLTLPRLEARLRGWLLRRREEEQASVPWLELVDLRPRDPAKPVGELSGGNQQKVLFARWLRALPRVLVVDEPTQGVDVGAVDRIYDVVRRAAANGTAFVVCSSDAAELAALCDRVLVLRRGVVVDELSGDALRRETVDRACLTTSPHREKDDDDEHR